MSNAVSATESAEKASARKLAYTFLLLAFCLLIAAPASLAQSTAQSTPANGVVATVQSQSISMEELEAHLQEPLRRIESERRQLLERGLEQLIEQRLLSLEAEKQGLELGAWIERDITSKINIDDAAIDAFYNENQARIRQPKEQVQEQIRRFLEQQKRQELQAEVIDRLRSSYAVKTLLEPYRAALPEAGDAPARGPEDAAVTLTIFSDFQCPGCRGIEPVLDAVREANEELKIVFRQYPLMSIHPQAFQAAEAALCAGEQGKFWEMHGSLFADQRSLARADLESRAASLQLDAGSFTACLDAGEAGAKVERDLQIGRSLGVSSTPSLFINGRPVDLGNLQGTPQQAIQALIDDELRRTAG